MDKQLRLGWIGTGVMGASMAGHLLAAGWPLTVYSRTKAKAEPLLQQGAHWAESPHQVAAEADVVFSMVGLPQDVEQVILSEDGVLQGLSAGGIICDMTTSSPALARRVATAATARGCHALDAPVTGGDVGAREARLSIFVGGDTQAYEQLLPCLERMGQKILHCGAAGSGQQAKLANQVAVAGVMFSVCESMLFAQEAGLDVANWLELVVPGAAGSTAMGTLGRRLLAEDYAPGFFIDHFVKDLGLCLEECRRMRLILPCVELAEEFYRILQAQGQGKQGTQSLIACLARLSGKEWHSHKARG